MRHISDSEWKKFYEGNMSDIGILEHTAKCEYCAARMAEYFDESLLVEPMPYLKESIVNEALRYDRGRRLTEKFEFAFYCARVCLAMSFALIMLFSGSNIINQGAFVEKYASVMSGEKSVAEGIGDVTDSMSEKLNNIYVSIVDFKYVSEVEKNENAEK